MHLRFVSCRLRWCLVGKRVWRCVISTSDAESYCVGFHVHSPIEAAEGRIFDRLTRYYCPLTKMAFFLSLMVQPIALCLRFFDLTVRPLPNAIQPCELIPCSRNNGACYGANGGRQSYSIICQKIRLSTAMLIQKDRRQYDLAYSALSLHHQPQGCRQPRVSKPNLGELSERSHPSSAPSS